MFVLPRQCYLNFKNHEQSYNKVSDIHIKSWFIMCCLLCINPQNELKWYPYITELEIQSLYVMLHCKERFHKKKIVISWEDRATVYIHGPHSVILFPSFLCHEIQKREMKVLWNNFLNSAWSRPDFEMLYNFSSPSSSSSSSSSLLSDFFPTSWYSHSRPDEDLLNAI